MFWWFLAQRSILYSLNFSSVEILSRKSIFRAVYYIHFTLLYEWIRIYVSIPSLMIMHVASKLCCQGILAVNIPFSLNHFIHVEPSLYDNYLEVELLGQMICAFLLLKDISNLSFREIVSIYILLAMIHNLPLLSAYF